MSDRFCVTVYIIFNLYEEHLIQILKIGKEFLKVYSVQSNQIIFVKGKKDFTQKIFNVNKILCYMLIQNCNNVDGFGRLLIVLNSSLF